MKNNVALKAIYNRYIKPLDPLHSQAVLAFKCALASFIALCIGHFLPREQAFWLVLSTALIIIIEVGNSASERYFMLVVHAILALSALYFGSLLGPHTFAFILFMFFATMLGIYCVHLKVEYRLAIIISLTFIIFAGNIHTDAIGALHRLYSGIVGACLAILVQFLVFPYRQESFIKRHLTQCRQSIAEYFTVLLFDILRDDYNPERHYAYKAKLISDISDVRRLLNSRHDSTYRDEFRSLNEVLYIIFALSELLGNTAASLTLFAINHSLHTVATVSKEAICDNSQVSINKIRAAIEELKNIDKSVMVYPLEINDIVLIRCLLEKLLHQLEQGHQ